MGQKEHQPPMTVEEQVANLRSLGLVIEREEAAVSILNDVSYFRLIKAFSLGLKPKNGNYNEGITFNQIVDLYKFNCNFRQILFPVIERIEVNLRCRLSNYFSSQYGVLGYEDPDNFANPEYHQEFLEDIKQEVKKTPSLHLSEISGRIMWTVKSPCMHWWNYSASELYPNFLRI